MKRPIYLTIEKKKSIQKEMGCSRVTVWRAMNGMVDSEVESRIREKALLLGGQYLYKEEGFCPNCETHFEHADGKVAYITQRFPNDVTLVMDFLLKVASVYDGDTVYISLDNVAEWPELIFDAQTLSISKEGK